MRHLILGTLLILVGCQPIVDRFASRELISSKGEHVYVNTLNWGVTRDRQMTTISKDKDHLRDRNDTNNVVRGLEPFFYSFKNDSLKIFYLDTIRYRISDSLETVKVSYFVLKREIFNQVRSKAYQNNEYYAVPLRSQEDYPFDMPLPKSN